MARPRRDVAAPVQRSTTESSPVADELPAIASHPRGATLNLLVTPRSGVTAFADLKGDAIRVRVAAPPVEGAANAELVRFLAAVAGVPKSAVHLESGATGRRKRVLIEGVAAAGLVARVRASLP